MRFCDIEIGHGLPATLCLSVTDALGPEMAAIRAGEIVDRTSGLQCFKAICIRDDARDPETFVQTVSAVRSIWNGAVILHSEEPASLLTASMSMEDKPLLTGCEPDSMEQLASITGCPISIRCRDLSTMLDHSGTIGENCVLDPDAINMKSCLELNTDLHRLSERLSEADRPILTRTWSGEYALAVASVSLMRYGSLIIMDDMDRDGCEALDSLSISFADRS